MSSYNCPDCKAPHVDTRWGYVTGCRCRAALELCNACGRAMDEVAGRDGWLECGRCLKEERERER